MGAFSQIGDLISDMGLALTRIIQNDNTLYAIYFISFFGIFYWLFYIGLNRKQFEGKPAKVISILLSVIVTGSLFFKYRSVNEMLTLMNSFIGSMVLLLIGAGFIALGIWLGYGKKGGNKEEHVIENKRMRSLLFWLGLFLGSSILLPLFGTVTNKTGIISAGQETWFYTVAVERFHAISILGDMLAWVQLISMLALIVVLVRMLWAAIHHMDNEYEPDKKSAEVRDVKRTIDSINKKIKKIDDSLKSMRNAFGGQ